MGDILFMLTEVHLRLRSLLALPRLLSDELFADDAIKILIHSLELLTQESLFNEKFVFGEDHLRLGLDLVELALFIRIVLQHALNQFCWIVDFATCDLKVFSRSIEMRVTTIRVLLLTMGCIKLLLLLDAFLHLLLYLR